uniref:Zinc-ribbon domain protein n=1 Tax=Siphoviridae sp. ctnks32 TaxID=2826457 RepID=A0A8S5N143_9CAUD|nr:MAG TPA: zinc-ribbon domain protein [Siphoviridae sp. ctnks32]
MAKRVVKVKKATRYRCRDCKKSYDWHEKSNETGLPFMCRCPYYTNGKFCKFLKDPQCEHFELKTND